MSRSQAPPFRPSYSSKWHRGWEELTPIRPAPYPKATEPSSKLFEKPEKKGFSYPTKPWDNPKAAFQGVPFEETKKHMP